MFISHPDPYCLLLFCTMSMTTEEHTEDICVELPKKECIIIHVETSMTVSLSPTDSSLRDRRLRDKEERLSLVLWKKPVTTLHYFLLETLIKLKELTLK